MQMMQRGEGCGVGNGVDRGCVAGRVDDDRGMLVSPFSSTLQHHGCADNEERGRRQST